jgi:hypothetical protein
MSGQRSGPVIGQVDPIGKQPDRHRPGHGTAPHRRRPAVTDNPCDHEVPSPGKCSSPWPEETLETPHPSKPGRTSVDQYHFTQARRERPSALLDAAGGGGSSVTLPCGVYR